MSVRDGKLIWKYTTTSFVHATPVLSGDVVYVAGNELHCFEALGDQPLGFVCVVGPRAG